LTRLRRANAALDRAEEEGRAEDCLRLAKDARGWLAHAERLIERLGLSPTSRAALGLQEAQASAAWIGATVDLRRLGESDLQTLEAILLRARVEEPSR
jgi:hypothetical protein